MLIAYIDFFWLFMFPNHILKEITVEIFFHELIFLL